MYILLTIASITLLLFVLFLYSKCKLRVEYFVPGKKRIRVGIFGVWFTLKKTKDKTSKKLPEKDKDSKRTLKDIKTSYKKTLETILEAKRRLIVEKAEFNVELGLWDAAATGIATGAAWAVIGSLKSFLKSNFIVNEYSANVRPYFMGEKLEVSFVAIFSMKIIDMLIVLKKFL